MPAFAILTNRKRALVALIHAAAFLVLAIRDFVVSAHLSGILAATTGSTRSRIFAVVYVIVSVILAYLLTISRCAAEQVYFAFCTASAGTGLWRAIAGDAAFPPGQYLRIGLLAYAVLTGVVILKIHSSRTIPFSEACTSVGEGVDV
ncbi:MAG TPA: hypothetical protein VMT53_02940 [Terriglobales bacterium]|nr:hypothetical protein [Terriglobales bacterium]